jgi:phospholipid/cholesterol/gamma-HCH transport system substrate-binding protein
METKANYLLNGVFVALVLAAIVFFVHWFETNSLFGSPAIYQIAFQGSVGGLGRGADVEFNGIKVGEVTEVQVDRRDWQRVLATVSIDPDTPMRNDTRVRLGFGTITGVAWIELFGGAPAAGPVANGGDGIPTLVAGADAGEGLSGQAQRLIDKLDNLTADDSSFHKTLDNIEVFTTVYRKNADRLDRILAQFGNLTGTTDKPGELTDAVKSIRLLGENFDKRMSELTPGIEEFTGPGLKNIEALITDTQRAIATAVRVFKNIGDNPSRVLFGGAPARQAAPRRSAQ